MRGPKAVIHVLLAAVLIAITYGDYWAYSLANKQDPQQYTGILQGRAPAPAQYRIGIVDPEDILALHSHVPLRYVMTLVDLLAAAIAIYLLFALLQRMKAYREATASLQWIYALGYLFLVQYYLSWLTWYQRPETMPTAALLAIALSLVTTKLRVGRPEAYFVTASLLIVVTVFQAFIRTDVALTLNVGIFVVCLFQPAVQLSLPRNLLAAVSAFGIAISGAIQIVLSRILFPQAHYGATRVIQLFTNFTDIMQMIPFALFLLPLGFTLWALLRRRTSRGEPAVALLAAAAAFLLMWCTVGRISEVRIFLPYALVLGPLTVVAVTDALSATFEPRTVQVLLAQAQ